ncbi:hypothetical protein BT63DRAFT_477045 [Microthyrium microscopicum]|uniref:F-box domain-containing protein n=1 Tax=Microthyrium microscopicum TaxID=703497 RepID=A0A6A6UMX7_9PEZI|nr:hypothetical protein BT63DRAFT_477045 [Microthyrium microscopicum]
MDGFQTLDDESTSLQDGSCDDSDYTSSSGNSTADHVYPTTKTFNFPILFFVEGSEQGVMSQEGSEPPFFPFLRLPYEIRMMIYPFALSVASEEEEEGHLRSWDDEYIYIIPSNDNVAFWMTAPLLSVCRQFRHEAAPIIFQDRVIHISFIPSFGPFLESLGPMGRWAIRKLEIQDILFPCGHSEDYLLEFVSLLGELKNLQELYINTDDLKNWYWGPLRDREGDRPVFNPVLQALTTLHLNKLEVISDVKDRETSDFSCLRRLLENAIEQRRPIEPPSAFANTLSITPAHSSYLPPFPVGIKEQDHSSDIMWQPEWSVVSIPIFNFLFLLYRTKLQSDLAMNEMVTYRAIFPLLHLKMPESSDGPIIGSCAICYHRGCHCGFHETPTKHGGQVVHSTEFSSAVTALAQLLWTKRPELVKTIMAVHYHLAVTRTKLEQDVNDAKAFWDHFAEQLMYKAKAHM